MVKFLGGLIIQIGLGVHISLDIINVINHMRVLTGKGFNNKPQCFRPFQCYHVMLLPTWRSAAWQHKEFNRLTCLGLAKLFFKQNNWKQITVFTDYHNKNLHKTANRFIRSLKKNMAKPHQNKNNAKALKPNSSFVFWPETEREI